MTFFAGVATVGMERLRREDGLHGRGWPSDRENSMMWIRFVNLASVSGAMSTCLWALLHIVWYVVVCEFLVAAGLSIPLVRLARPIAIIRVGWVVPVLAGVLIWL